VRAVAATILRRCGYMVLEAAGAGDALIVCEKHGGEIDLLLTDVVMPHMNGRELAERVAHLRPRAKVLFMSGYTEDAAVRQGLLAAGITLLHKPITPATLSAKVREVLDGRTEPSTSLALASGMPPPA